MAPKRHDRAGNAVSSARPPTCEIPNVSQQVCLCPCIRIDMDACVHVCIHICHMTYNSGYTHACCLRMCTCARLCTNALWVHTQVWACAWIDRHTYDNAHACSCTYTWGGAVAWQHMFMKYACTQVFMLRAWFINVSKWTCVIYVHGCIWHMCMCVHLCMCAGCVNQPRYPGV